MLTIPQQLVDEIEATLTAAEELLQSLPEGNARYGVVAGQCAIAKVYLATAPRGPRFAMTYCSQCGMEQGPGDDGVSNCSDHRPAHIRRLRLAGADS